MESFTRTEAKEVLTMDDYGAIRRAHRDGKSIRRIAREFNHSANHHQEDSRTSRAQPNDSKSNCSKTWALPEIIDQILADDETAPLKQRHTATQVLTSPAATNMITADATAKCNAMCASIANRHRRDLYSAGASSGPTPRSRFRPYPRRFPRWTPARSVPGCHLGLLQLSLRSGTPV